MTCGKLQLIGSTVRSLCTCGKNKCSIRKCLFWSVLLKITMMDEVIEIRFRKFKNEELLRIFPINAVICTWKLTEENKDRKRFSSLHK